jgi:acyl carrier protein
VRATRAAGRTGKTGNFMNAPNADSSEAVVHRHLRRHYPRAPQALTPELRFEADLGGDSLSFVELALGVSRELRVSLPDRETAAVRTIGELIALADACRKK